MEVTINQTLTALADLFLPRLCCVCGEELGMNERDICLGCLAQMPLTHNWTLTRNPMAERFNALIAGREADEWDLREASPGSEAPEEGGLEQEAPGSPTPYSYAVALFNFAKEGGFRHITYRLKYGRDIALGRHFAGMLGEKIAGAEQFGDLDAVIPVPLHWTRRLSRGYNQAEVIAKEIAAKTGAPLRADILRRRKATRTQTRLSVEAKKRNVSGAFTVRKMALKGFAIPSALPGSANAKPAAKPGGSAASAGEVPTLRRSSPKSPPPRHILLVDDVFTTGSTLYNCYLPLREAFGGEVRISVATLGVV